MDGPPRQDVRLPVRGNLTAAALSNHTRSAHRHLLTEPHPKIILASQSPRRRYLLERAGLKFKVVPSAVDEASVGRFDPAEYVRALAEAKAREIAGRYRDSWVIGADTVVVGAGRVLGKPASRAEARDMLRRLSGRTHEVLTGWCVFRGAGGVVYADTVCTDGS